MMADKTGTYVIYLDDRSKNHDALITADWGKPDNGAVNLVYVSKDPAKQDQYGEQIQRPTSVPYIKQGGGYEKIMANCWCFEEEWKTEFSKKTPQR